jgi:hypothetical protein
VSKESVDGREKPQTTLKYCLALICLYMAKCICERAVQVSVTCPCPCVADEVVVEPSHHSHLPDSAAGTASRFVAGPHAMISVEACGVASFPHLLQRSSSASAPCAPGGLGSSRRTCGKLCVKIMTSVFGDANLFLDTQCKLVNLTHSVACTCCSPVSVRIL